MLHSQADLVSNDKAKGATETKAKAVLSSHDQMEKYLERYVGLMLFVKEIDDQRYQQICAVCLPCGDCSSPD